MVSFALELGECELSYKLAARVAIVPAKRKPSRLIACVFMLSLYSRAHGLYVRIDDL